MEKNNATVWRELFATWPTTFRRKGVVLRSSGEGIPFVDFLMSTDVLILERATPDNVGARRVAVSFDAIFGLKYTEPLKTEQYEEAGFVKSMNIAAIQGSANPSPTQQNAPAAQTAPAAAVADPYQAVLEQAQAVQQEMGAATAQPATPPAAKPEDPFANDIPYKAQAQPYAAKSLQVQTTTQPEEPTGAE